MTNGKVLYNTVTRTGRLMQFHLSQTDDGGGSNEIQSLQGRGRRGAAF